MLNYLIKLFNLIMAEKTEIYKLIYKKDNRFKKFIRILGKNFFKKNKYVGRMIIDNKIKPLKETIKLKDIKKDKFIIKLFSFKKFKIKVICLKIVYL